jgi:hypothetical protein
MFNRKLLIALAAGAALTMGGATAASAQTGPPSTDSCANWPEVVRVDATHLKARAVARCYQYYPINLSVAGWTTLGSKVMGRSGYAFGMAEDYVATKWYTFYDAPGLQTYDIASEMVVNIQGPIIYNIWHVKY